MKRISKPIVFFASLVTLFGIGLTLTLPVSQALACGWGEGGGQAFVPQRRDNGGNYAQRPALTAEQARQKIENHVKRLNSSLKVGQINDAGTLYEAKIVTAENELVQIIGVEKNSGRLVLIN